MEKPSLTRLKKRCERFLRSLSLPLAIGWGLSALSLFLFVKLSDELLENELLEFDNTITAIVRFHMTEPTTLWMTYFSEMGSAFVLIVLTVFISILLLYHRRVWDTIQLGLVLSGAIVLNQLLKFLFQRQRPSLEHLVSASGLSFPSGHAMVSYAFYGLLIYIVITNFRSKWVRGVLSASIGLLILFIGVSRIYLGVHYPSDVLAGFAAGSFWLASCIYVLKKLKPKGGSFL